MLEYRLSFCVIEQIRRRFGLAWQESGTEFYEMIPHLPSTLEKQIGIWVLTSGRNRAKSTYRVGPRYFTYYSLHIILSGELRLSYRGNQVDLKMGAMFCMHPGETYVYQINACGSELQMAWIAFQGPLAAAKLEHTLLSADRPYVHNGVTRELTAIMQTIRELISQQLDQSLLLTGRLLEFLHLLLVASSTNGSSSSNSLPTWLERGKLYMDVHYEEGINVEQVSDWLGISRSHFSKAFSKHTGTSPFHYLQALRMKEAQKRLLETSYSVTEIALSLGYGDLFAFTRAFNLYYGIAPKHFRDMHRES
jgi:AraC-like DNA-binding protein